MLNFTSIMASPLVPMEGHRSPDTCSYNIEYYTRMIVETFSMWEQIEKESGVTFYQ